MSHNYWLIAASLLVVMMAGFTGLSLMRGSSKLNVDQRKRFVIMSAIAMGTGIWSMHFVAMLGMELSTPFFYDALTTLASALVAILVVGIALILLHFTPRTTKIKIIAGLIFGLGILVMHYLGMYGILLVQPIYSTLGILIAIVVSIGLSISMVYISYNDRENKNIIAGTFVFGIAVFMVHFVAMMGTHFEKIENVAVPDTWLSNEILAIGVALASFIISGAFLLMSVSLLPAQINQEKNNALANVIDDEFVAQNVDDKSSLASIVQPDLKSIAKLDEEVSQELQIPYEKNNRTLYISGSNVAAIRAEGHYTILYSENGKHFCPWTISEIAKRLSGSNFIQTHRSYLVNPIHVTRFERKKDNGVCFFNNTHSLEKVPVSRSKLSAVRDELSL